MHSDGIIVEAAEKLIDGDGDGGGGFWFVLFTFSSFLSKVSSVSHFLKLCVHFFLAGRVWACRGYMGNHISPVVFFVFPPFQKDTYFPASDTGGVYLCWHIWSLNPNLLKIR